MTLEELATVASEQAARLQDRYGLSEENLQRLDELTEAGSAETSSLIGLLWHLPYDYLRMRLRLMRFWRQLPELPRGQARGLHRLTLERAQLRQRASVLGRLQELFHYWHVFHKPFAIIMYVFMVVHIGVAIATGYGWGPE